MQETHNFKYKGVGKENLNNDLSMIFMGRKKYAAKMLKWTVDRGIRVVAVCTDTQERFSPTESMARTLGIPVIEMEEAESLVENNPEAANLVVSYLFWRKIRKPLIEIPQYGCINFHPAILPDWRGTAGYNIAILNRLSSWGATAHYVDETIDTGNIIRIYRFDFDYRTETASTLEKKTQSIQMDLYKSVVLDILESGRLKSVPQSCGTGVYVSRKEMEEMKKIDVEKDDIDLKIRAFWFPPYDGAYIELKGRKYTLVNREILEDIAGGVKADSSPFMRKCLLNAMYVMRFGVAA